MVTQTDIKVKGSRQSREPEIKRATEPGRLANNQASQATKRGDSERTSNQESEKSEGTGDRRCGVRASEQTPR